jgi:hypothetical protein
VIASYMLPEGGHNRLQDTTYFIVNRRKGAETLNELQRIQSEGGPLKLMTNRQMSAERIEQLRGLASRKNVMGADAGQRLALY